MLRRSSLLQRTGVACFRQNEIILIWQGSSFEELGFEAWALCYDTDSTF